MYPAFFHMIDCLYNVGLCDNGQVPAVVFLSQ